MPVSGDGDTEREVQLQLLGSVAATAVAVAASRERDTPPVPAPSALRPYLGFTRLPPRAVGPVLELLDTDDALRVAVADAVDESDLSGAVIAWLRRPEGWEEQWSEAVDAAREQREDRAGRDRERRAERDRATVEEALHRATAELSDLRSELRELRDLRHALESKVAALAHELGRAQEQADRAVEERTRAVRELKDTERRLAARIDEVRDLRSEIAAGASSQPDPTPAPPPDPAWSDVRDMVDELAALARRLTEVAEAPGRAAARPDPERTRPSRRGSTAARRPIRVGRGIPEGSVEEVLALLAAPDVVVLVDGYNVTMTGWPRLSAAEQRAALDRLVSNLVSRTAEVHLVYDGEGEGAAGHSVAGSAVRTWFTATEREADDEIIDRVGVIDPTRPVLVVSSDARVADGARRGGANVVSSQLFLDALTQRGVGG